MEIWLTIIGMGIVTFGVRLLPLTTIREDALPDWARRGLRYVPVAVLSAISAPEFLPAQDWFQFTVDGRLVAGIAAIITAWYTRSSILTILVGTLILVLLR